MWKRSKSQTALSTVVDVTQTINNVLLDTLTLQIETQQFSGTRGDDDFSRIQLKLLENMLKLNEIQKYCETNTEIHNIKEIEVKIRNLLSNLEINAAGGKRTTFPLGKINNSIATDTYQSDTPKSNELSDVEKLIYQAKMEIHNLEKKLENQNVIVTTTNINILEQKIVQLSEELEKLEIDDKSTDLYKIKGDLLKALVKCSGKLKKIGRKNSTSQATVVDGFVKEEDKQLQQIRQDLAELEEKMQQTRTKDANLLLKTNCENLIKQSNEALLDLTDELLKQDCNEVVRKINRIIKKLEIEDNEPQVMHRTSFDILNNRLSNLREQISLIYNNNHQEQPSNSFINTTTTEDTTTTDTKIKLTAFKLAWKDLMQHLSSREIETETLEEVAVELNDMQVNLTATIRRIKKIIRRERRSTSDEYDETKIKMKELVDGIQTLRSKVNSYSGIYGDQRFRENKYELECFLQKVEDLESSDIKIQLAKTKIKSKLLEYLQMLDEKSVKL